MRVVVAYPPLNKDKGTPTLGGNRQFQYFKSPTYIYPLVAAQIATRFKNQGHNVRWIDGIAADLTASEFILQIYDFKPDIVYLETKAPVHAQIERWKIIIEAHCDCTVSLFGDHAKYLGIDPFNYDDLDFDIDRNLTKWWLYAYDNGNYKNIPGTYIMSARDCWWGKCTFCSWPHNLYPEYMVRKSSDVLGEVNDLSKMYGIKEFMDDSGTFPTGEWLHNFCKGIKGLDKKVTIDCNMRFGKLGIEDYKMMKKAGFRLVLFGLESGNQATLDRLHKGITVQQIIDGCRTATRAGLYPHITVMFGYPWESFEDALCTRNLAVWLLKKGYAYTAQASLCIPYPGTPLYQECKDNKWLLTEDYDDYDQTKPVMKVPYPHVDLYHFITSVYRVSYHPTFLFNKLLRVRDLSDLKYFSRISKKIFSRTSK